MKRPAAVPTQRWASVPAEAETLPLRQNLLSWTTPQRNAVYAYVGRQYTQELQIWIELRATQYRQAFPDQKELRLWHEAAADLLGWQREIHPSKVLPWLAEWESAMAEMENSQ